MDSRTERDPLGELTVPADVYYGAQTARAVANFAISGLRAHTDLVTATVLIKKAAGLKSGSKEPGKVSAGTIKRSQLSEIAETKMKDLNANDIEAATKIIEGSARAMGLQVVEG